MSLKNLLSIFILIAVSAGSSFVSSTAFSKGLFSSRNTSTAKTAPQPHLMTDPNHVSKILGHPLTSTQLRNLKRNLANPEIQARLKRSNGRNSTNEKVAQGLTEANPDVNLFGPPKGYEYISYNPDVDPLSDTRQWPIQPKQVK